MTEAPALPGVGELFRLDSLAQTAAPDGGTESWFRYVIVQGDNVITGLRQGTLAELDPMLRHMVQRLNERAGKQRAKLLKGRR